MKKKIKIFILTGPANWYSFDPESQNSSFRYRELHNQAQGLMQAKKKMKNSGSRYREPHNRAQALMQAKKHEKENRIFHTYRAS
jgi:hypothetical protein